MGRGDYRNYYKGHMDKTKGEGTVGRRVFRNYHKGHRNKTK